MHIQNSDICHIYVYAAILNVDYETTANHCRRVIVHNRQRTVD